MFSVPAEMNILIKEHFNRWYSMKMYYLSVNLIDIPLSVSDCSKYTVDIIRGKAYKQKKKLCTKNKKLNIENKKRTDLHEISENEIQNLQVMVRNCME